MSIIIEATPERQEQLGVSPQAVLIHEVEFAAKLRSAYEQRFAIYSNALPANFAPFFFRVSVDFDAERRKSSSTSVRLEEDEIVFDFGLYETLLEIYIFEGWAGILLIEAALDQRLPRTQEHSPSAGTPIDERALWLPVKDFFRFTRNLLALFIREMLVQIERRAASAVKYTLKRSAERVAKAWTDFDIRDGYRYELVPFSEGRFDKVKFYFFGKRAVSDALLQELSKAVQQKIAYEEALQREARFRQHIETIRGYLKRTRARAQPGEKERLERSLTELDIKQVAVKRLTDQSGALLKSTLTVIEKNYSLGLLALDGLEPGFEREEMEHKLGAALTELSRSIEQVGQRIDPGSSRVAAQIPAVGTDQWITWSDIENWNPPSECLSLGIESHIVDAAVKHMGDDSGWSPLAHEATWHRLVESGALPKDSFEYVVYVHYVSALIDRVEVERQAERFFEAFWKGFSRVAAALSLASLATPVTAGLAPMLRGVSVVADLCVMAHGIYSVVGSLAQLDEDLANELIRPDAFALEHLARVGELAAIRRESVDTIALQAALELALIGVGSQWATVKKLTLARGYYSDLETFLGVNDGEENQSEDSR